MNRLKMTLYLIFVYCMMTGSIYHQLQAVTYSVDNNHPSASDNNPGIPALPWLTIQHAVENVNPGDTILVAAGQYSGARIEASGTSSEFITLRGENGTVLYSPGSKNKHNSILELETWSGSGIVAYWIIECLEINNSPNWGIDLRGTNFIILRNNHVHHSGITGIFTAFTDSVVITENISHHNGEHGIYQSNSGDYPWIHHNTLYDNYACGIHMNGDESMGGDGEISYAIIETNTIYGNGTGGGAGINMDGVSHSVIRNNLLYNNHAGGITLYQIDGAVASNNNRILNNTIVMPDDGRWAVNLAHTGCINNKIFNNIIFTYHSWRGAIVIPTPALAGFESDYNIVINRFSTDDGNSVINLTAWQALGYDTHSFVSDPPQIFADHLQNDFHLKENSPAIDNGIQLPDVLFDIEKNPRPAGAAYDIGAYEFDSAPRIYYVATNGDDNNAGTDPAQPWRTVQHAADMMTAGDSVIIKGGVYNEQLSTVRDGNAQTGPIVFSHWPGETPIIDGTGVQTGQTGFNISHSYINLRGLEIRNWNNTGIWMTTGGYIKIYSCKVHNMPFGIGAADGVHDFVLDGVEIYNFDLYGFDASPSGGADCYNGTFRNCSAHSGRDNQQNVDGFALGHGTQQNFDFINCTAYDVFDGFDISSKNTSLERCLAYNCWNGCYKLWQDRIKLVNCIGYNADISIAELDWDGTPGCVSLINCTFFNSGVYTIWVENLQDTLKMSNCILSGGDNIGLAFEQMGSLNYFGDYNLFHNDNTSRAIAVAYTDEFSIDQIQNGTWTAYSGQDAFSIASTDINNIFKNSTQEDFTPAADGLLIDNGTVQNAPSVDFDNNPRPVGAGIDIGAYELQFTQVYYNFPNAGWYLVSLAVQPENSSVAQLFPQAYDGIAYLWDTASSAYTTVENMLTGIGYWLYFDQAVNYWVSGSPIQEYTIIIPSPGWASIGSLTEIVTFADPEDTPDASILLPAFSWNHTLSTYTATETLNPTEGQWIAVSQPCTLTVSLNGGALGKHSSTQSQDFIKIYGQNPPTPPAISTIKNVVIHPSDYSLFQNYPNPFNQNTNISFELPSSSTVKLTIHNIAGQPIKTLLHTTLMSGLHKLNWDGTDLNGKAAPSGVYIIRMETAQFSESKKLLLIR
ncbi:right-handed parallel beta-helix repeat-containing protein [candidate division KSB1 bacterium]|nr:right-handed parallel beta-helix repeat-containing protein [candidate division KSB1 bacterium]